MCIRTWPGPYFFWEVLYDRIVFKRANKCIKIMTSEWFENESVSIERWHQISSFHEVSAAIGMPDDKFMLKQRVDGIVTGSTCADEKTLSIHSGF